MRLLIADTVMHSVDILLRRGTLWQLLDSRDAVQEAILFDKVMCGQSIVATFRW